MSWLRSGLHSISITDWLTPGPPLADSPSAGLEDARRAMLDALGDGDARKRATLALKIRSARDVHALWDLRADLMTAISQLHGESEGRRRLAAATAQFEGLVPAAAALTSTRRAHGMQRRA